MAGLTGDRRAQAALLALPVVFFAVSLLLRQAGGPFWEWHLVDPAYFYLFDSLHIAQFKSPGHPYHPGTPVQILGGIVIRAAHPFASAADLAAHVLDDPEGHLRLISTTFLMLIAMALLAAGMAVRALTGNLALALFTQAGPFLSMVTLKNAYQPRPESLLIVVALALAVMVLAAGRVWTRKDGLPRRWVAVLGALAGLGVATKLTAAPVFLLPVFLLGGVRGLVLYGVSAAAAFLFFIAPALPNIGQAVELAVATLARSGAYGGGDKTVIDFARYPRDVLDVAARPVVHVQIVFGLAALAIAAWRRRGGLAVPAFETRALAGLALAVTAQVLAVAKQPTANYMVPAYMLMPLAAVLLYRFVAALGWGGDVVRARWRTAVSVLLVALIAAQAFGVKRQLADLAGKHAHARGFDDGRFAACTRIYFFPAGSPSFALHLGDWWTGSRHGAAIKARVPATDLWFEQNTMDLRDALGSYPVDRARAERSCVFMRGGHPGPISAFFARHAPDARFAATCSTRDETIFTLGVDCKGAGK